MMYMYLGILVRLRANHIGIKCVGMGGTSSYVLLNHVNVLLTGVW